MECAKKILPKAVYDDEVVAFDMYFASIYSMQQHPGAGTRGHIPLSVAECKDLALNMIIERRSLLGGL